MKKYTHILWDFNGTLLDDAAASFRATNTLLRRQGLTCLADVDDMRRRFGFPVKDYYVGLGFDFSRQSYEELAVEWTALYEAECLGCGACPHAVEVVTKLKMAGFSQTIISACEHEMLERKLASLGLGGCFDEVLGTDNVNAHGKLGLAQAWRAAHPEAVALMIGDTPHDSEMAVSIGADCLLYCGGYVSRERLAAQGCPVTDSLMEVLSRAGLTSIEAK